MMPRTNRGPLLQAGLLLGIGLGGFADGILLHQILQWHNMLSSLYPPNDLVSIKYNMVFDGLFHAMTWLVTVAGVAALWRAGAKPDVAWSGRTFLGSTFIGYGLFSLVEGTIDHQLLGLHHVHPGRAQLAWDVGFLLFGAILAIAGYVLVRQGRRSLPHTNL